MLETLLLMLNHPIRASSNPEGSSWLNGERLCWLGDGWSFSIWLASYGRSACETERTRCGERNFQVKNRHLQGCCCIAFVEEGCLVVLEPTNGTSQPIHQLLPSLNTYQYWYYSRLFTVPYFSVRSSWYSASYRQWRPSWFSNVPRERASGIIHVALQDGNQ